MAPTQDAQVIPLMEILALRLLSGMAMKETGGGEVASLADADGERRPADV